MVKDKNGTEIRIGDTVHYKRPETTHEFNGRTMTRPARDVIFTVDEFVDSPFVKHGGRDPRLSENRIWISGHGLDFTRNGSRNAVSPLAVVKIDTLVKKKVTSLSFVEVQPPTENLSVRDAFTSDLPTTERPFITSLLEITKSWFK
jgi:hypothetical protein